MSQVMKAFFSAVFIIAISVMAQIVNVVGSKCLGVDQFVSVSICLDLLNSGSQKTH